MTAKSETLRSAQFGIRNLLILTALIAAAIAFPEFAVAVPFAIGLCAMVLLIVSIAWLATFVGYGRSNSFAKAAEQNAISLAIVMLGLLAYGVYSIVVMG